MTAACATATLLVVLAAAAVSAQDILQNNNFIHDLDAAHKFGCGCMEYWTCVMRCSTLQRGFAHFFPGGAKTRKKCLISDKVENPHNGLLAVLAILD